MIIYNDPGWKPIESFPINRFDPVEVGYWNKLIPQWVSHIARRHRDGTWITTTGCMIATPDWWCERHIPPPINPHT